MTFKGLFQLKQLYNSKPDSKIKKKKNKSQNKKRCYVPMFYAGDT